MSIPVKARVSRRHFIDSAIFLTPCFCELPLVFGNHFDKFYSDVNPCVMPSLPVFFVRAFVFLAAACALSRSAEPSFTIISTNVVCKEPGRYVGWPTIAKTSQNELLIVFSGDR